MNINNFGPFNADVWGSVSDWAMVAVTFYTLRYLRDTLKSQKDVQSLQQENTRIEQYKHRSSLKPTFALDAVTFKDDTIEQLVNLIVKFTFKANDNPAFKLSLKDSEFNKGWQVRFNINSQRNVLKGDEFSFYAGFQVQMRDNMYADTITFILNYNDADRNNYNQHIEYTVINGSHFRTINLPEFVEKLAAD